MKTLILNFKNAVVVHISNLLLLRSDNYQCFTLFVVIALMHTSITHLSNVTLISETPNAKALCVPFLHATTHLRRRCYLFPTSSSTHAICFTRTYIQCKLFEVKTASSATYQMARKRMPRGFLSGTVRRGRWLSDN